ncbi:MAG TPA: hydrogenase accessory protein HypB [Chromatiales bacterium]|nr:hydrogenase accessory protein HypB [Chromatiales bacterium]
MCEHCGCTLTGGDAHLPEAGTPGGSRTVEVLEGLLAANDRAAAHNRAHLARHGVAAVNLMSAPGSGKTALLEATIEALAGELRIAVVEGDLATENDAERIRARGVPAVQIATGTACHLDAHLVHRALHELDLAAVDLLLIENVGNLVCPAAFDLGQHRSVALVSVPEGDDKPAKYPVLFRAADLVLVSKCDLLGVLDGFDPAAVERHVRALASAAPVWRVSARTGEGLARWCGWLRALVAEVRAGAAPAAR